MINSNEMNNGMASVETPIVNPPRPLSDQEKRERFVALRDKYEKPNRDHTAEYFRNEKRMAREARDKSEAQMILAQLQDKEQASDQVKYLEERFTRNTEYARMQKSELEARINDISEEIKNRSLLKKLWYKIAKDPLRAASKPLQNETATFQKQIEEKQQEKDLAIASLQATPKLDSYDNWKINTKETLRKRTAEIRDSVGRLNSASREAILNTVEALERGDLDISKLAIEANAIVIHAIPLEGWNAMNTSMNNSEVDIKAITSHEKLAIIQGKAPDLSASVLSVGKKIEGQNTMYPFGLILDGKIMSAHEGDALTETKGDVKIKHPQYLDNTTLQSDVASEFKKIANKRATNNEWNEAIVSSPKIKAIFIDETKLDGTYYFGDRFSTIYQNEADTQKIIDAYGQDNLDIGRNPSTGQIKITRSRSGLEKAITYAKEHYPDLPIYLRKNDGVCDINGNKVTAEDIYK